MSKKRRLGPSWELNVYFVDSTVILAQILAMFFYDFSLMPSISNTKEDIVQKVCSTS